MIVPSAVLLSMMMALSLPTRSGPAGLNSDQAVISYTDKVIIANHLSPSVGCLQYSADRSNPALIFVDVLEIHSKKCGGDPGVSPVIFSLKYDRKTKAVLTNEGSVEDKFCRIRAP